MAPLLSRALIGVALATVAAVGGCRDPADDYAEFLDASASFRGQTAPIAASHLEDLTGDWFVHALLAGGLPLSLRMRFSMDVTQTPIPLTAMIWTASANLDTDPPLDTVTSVVGADGRFTLRAEPLIIAKGAVKGVNIAVTANIDMDNYTQSADEWCGGATGAIVDPFPLDLAGSTLGALRDTTHTLTVDQVPGRCPVPDMM